MKTEIISFGFKYGALEADMVFDLRCLANPYWEEALRPLSGLEEPVRDYIFADPDSAAFLRTMAELVRIQVRLAERKGKDTLTVAVGCTGGHHRSVAGADYLARVLEGPCRVLHRDLHRENPQ